MMVFLTLQVLGVHELIQKMFCPSLNCCFIVCTSFIWRFIVSHIVINHI